MKLVIFDLDGVLINSKKAWIEGAKKAFKHFNVKVSNAAIEKELWRETHEFFETLVPKSVKNRKQTVDKCFEICEGFVLFGEGKKMIVGIESSKETLTKLKKKGVKIAVATNSHRDFTETNLKRFNLLKCINSIVTADDKVPNKPDPARLIVLMKRFNASKQETAYIGDAPTDIKTGKNAGVITIAVTEGWYKASELKKEKPDFIIKNITELEKVL